MIKVTAVPNLCGRVLDRPAGAGLLLPLSIDTIVLSGDNKWI